MVKRDGKKGNKSLTRGHLSTAGVLCLQRRKALLPLCGKLLPRSVAYLANIGKPVTPFIWSSCLDDHSRVMAVLAGRNNGIEGPAPGTAQNINRNCWIKASSYGPEHIIQIPDMDVVVDHHNVTTQIGAGMALASDESSLFRVAWVALFDCDHNHESLGWRRQINSTNVRNAGLLHSVPYCGCPQTGSIHAMNGWLERRSATNNRIVAMV